MVSDTWGSLYLLPPVRLLPDFPWDLGPGLSFSVRLPNSSSQANWLSGNKVKEKPFPSRKINGIHKPEEKKTKRFPVCAHICPYRKVHVAFISQLVNHMAERKCKSSFNSPVCFPWKMLLGFFSGPTGVSFMQTACPP